MGLEKEVHRKSKRLKETAFENLPTLKRVIDNVKVMRRSKCSAPITSGAAPGSEENVSNKKGRGTGKKIY